MRRLVQSGIDARLDVKVEIRDQVGPGIPTRIVSGVARRTMSTLYIVFRKKRPTAGLASLRVRSILLYGDASLMRRAAATRMPLPSYLGID
jgi:hypothetical protein